VNRPVAAGASRLFAVPALEKWSWCTIDKGLFFYDSGSLHAQASNLHQSQEKKHEKTTWGGECPTAWI
jgi:hypothetical protein